MAKKTITLDVFEAKTIRRMLLVGLCSYGECTRVINAFKSSRTMGKDIDEELMPLETGDENTICDFANALQIIEDNSAEA